MVISIYKVAPFVGGAMLPERLSKVWRALYYKQWCQEGTRLVMSMILLSQGEKDWHRKLDVGYISFT